MKLSLKSRFKTIKREKTTEETILLCEKIRCAPNFHAIHRILWRYEIYSFEDFCLHRYKSWLAWVFLELIFAKILCIRMIHWIAKKNFRWNVFSRHKICILNKSIGFFNFAYYIHSLFATFLFHIHTPSLKIHWQTLPLVRSINYGQGISSRTLSLCVFFLRPK